MIEKLLVKNFKAFVDASFDFSNLNLFTGLNGMGKSTVHQILLLLRQSQQRAKTEKILSLKGNLVDLGRWNDVYANYALNDALVIETCVDGKDFSFHASKDFNTKGNENRDTLITNDNEIAKADFWETTLFKHRFVYLSADRVAPQTSYTLGGDNKVYELRELGNRGEFAFQYLEYAQDEFILIQKHEKAADNTLLSNVTAWLGEISPSVRLNLQSNTEVDMLQLAFNFSGTETGETQKFRPQNVGFGITYILPIIVAVLAAKEGDILIIENPEAHLHPRGQSRMGQLLALAAHTGVQIFVETHSDHVLNGIRVATKQEKIIPEDIRIYYFERNGEKSIEQHATNIQEVKINAKGRLNIWPIGFFDEWDNMLDILI